ncbi:MerR family transcriptional regulator [Embleya sp. NPDC008237]|uniref:MerR family transcriptional regulator n=1 Tax=Embleya sp. NPDC008237 TaxID=3363978 RepID=UPI0036E1418E
MRIGDLEHQTGVSKRLLRYYEEQGLLTPTRRDNGYREYTEADLTRVRHIRALLAAGLPTAVIAKVIHCVHDKDGLGTPSAACPTFVEELRRESARITETITHLEGSRHVLDTILAVALRKTEGVAGL